MKNTDKKTVTVYRVDDKDFKPRIADDGTVPVVKTKSDKERALFINIGQPDRAKKFALENRKGNATVTSVEADAELLENLRKRSIYDKSAEAATNKTAPLKVDINKAPDQYGLRTKEDIDLLRDSIDPSTVKKIDPNDL